MTIETAKERFYKFGADEEQSPLERLRFFCSLAMNGQDWIDVEPFFDDVEADAKLLAAQAANKRLREALVVCKKEMVGDKWDALYLDGVLSTPDDTAEIDALVKDAERYRWLRDCTQSADWEYFGSQTPENTDIAIDAEMQKEKP